MRHGPPMLATWACLLLAACGSEPEAPTPSERLVFVRDGVLGGGGSGGQAVGGARELVTRAWTPGESVTVGGRTDAAPRSPECVPLFHVDLGDVDSLISRGVSTPGTAVAWSPDGASLAIGSYLGEVLVVDGWTGAVRARRTLAETMIKRVAWSPDGAVVYASEQSPDAFVHALEARDLTSRWSFRLADDLDTSPAPPETDVYGVFTLPAGYGLEVMETGDLIVVGTHAWPVGDGESRNKSRVLRLTPNGEVRARFPKDAPADATFRFPRLDEVEDRMIFAVGRSATGPAPPDLPIDGVQVLDLETMEPVFHHVGEPMRPHFKRAYSWEAIDVQGDRLLAGFGDGRAQIVNLDGSGGTTHALGTAIVSGDVPIAASVGWGRFLKSGGLAVNTGTTNIPWGSDVAASRPPAAHPGENTLWVYGADGELDWTFRGEPAIQGITTSPDGEHLVIGGGPRTTDHRRDLFGAFVFRLGGDGTGQERLVASCPTESPVFFRHALRDDGRVAVSEVPYQDETAGAVLGEYRVTVLR